MTKKLLILAVLLIRMHACLGAQNGTAHSTTLADNPTTAGESTSSAGTTAPVDGSTSANATSVTQPITTNAISTQSNATTPPTTTPMEAARYVIKHDDVICMLANLNTSIRISYEAYGEFNQTIAKTVLVEVDDNADTFSSTCAATLQDAATLTLRWDQRSFKLAIEFTVAEDPSNSSMSTWSLTQITFTYDKSNKLYFPDAVVDEKLTVKKDNISLFTTKVGESYLCAAGDEILMGEIEKGAVVTFTEIQLQPFAVRGGEFGTANVCVVDEELEKMKNENWLVPVVVAGCLAFIILVLLTVYVISRNAKRDGYKNMD